MIPDPNLHPIQGDILRVLLFKPEARFSDLNAQGISTDHFTFHLRRLVERGLVEKTETSRYRLTPIGKEFANRFDVDGTAVALERQAKIGALVGCVRGVGARRKYLIQQRLKQPYYGFHGFLTGKVKWGETLLETASRELKEETGLDARFTLVGLKHKMDYSLTGELLEDKYFYVFRGERSTGELRAAFEGGKNIWLAKTEIAKLPELFDDVLETLEMLDQNNLAFSEKKYTVAKY